ncbi:hypothetical protein [Streptomyces qinglanensis]|uniref:Uncharacterized protein n=1 Tax=Streptomyces qinglanensis TaxID=943816 RepID=A0A1H9U369_9ACTN|nr:hypothetical protein [Streptomyces qinglanensis]SES03691.1 hypothetical protein SAMN05421870_107261 [Streptomyces qinglanensis]
MPAKRDPRFRKWQIVTHGSQPRMQVLKVSWDEQGNPIYKIRHYNSLAFFTGEWVTEEALHPVSA